jgi:NAD(P)-dependent dehydrogenase (short-subunit alcohol dehydrogenase family)
VEVNLVGTLQVTQAVLPTMLRQRSGRIVNLGSLAGKDGLAGLTGYSAASAGVIAFTKALSRELAKDNVFVNCVAPGPIDTDMIRHLGVEVVTRMIQDSPTGRHGTGDEVAQLVAWMCSDASRFNTGAIFDMSGGRARY